MSLIRLSSGASSDEVMAILQEHGYCIVENLASPAEIDAINGEMARHLEAAHSGNVEGLGTRTRRAGALISRSPASRRLIAHPSVLQIADRLLRKNATAFQLNLTQLICIDPGEQAQVLHRDENAWDHFAFPIDYDVELSTIWALDDFTEENGATRIVPGSHKTDRALGLYSQADTLPALMPRGSLLVYSGKVVHGGGANRSRSSRRALNVDYCVAWVRQEENQYLTIPIEVARTLDRDLQKLMGYQMGSVGMGYVRNYEDPVVALYPDMGPVPGITEELMQEYERVRRSSEARR